MPNYPGKYLRRSHPRPFLWIGLGCSILALVCACFVVKFVYDAVKTSHARQQTIDTYVIPMPTESEATLPNQTQSAPTAAPDEPPETTGETTVPTQPPRFPAIDFPGLREKNGDVVAWLQVPALEIINYPVAQGEDNAYYVSHSWDGEESENGAIFLDFQNQGDFSQLHNILYGHCMKDGSMFQSLGKWEGPEFFYSSDRTILLYLPDETRVYEIFAVERVNALDSRVYRTDYTADEVWEAALRETLHKSQHGTDLELTAQSEVLTLSTCIGEMNRLVVHAVCVEHVPL